MNQEVTSSHTGERVPFYVESISAYIRQWAKASKLVAALKRSHVDIRRAESGLLAVALSVLLPGAEFWILAGDSCGKSDRLSDYRLLRIIVRWHGAFLDASGLLGMSEIAVI